jgi:hypothetical protein
MNSCKTFEKLMTESLFGELDEKSKTMLENHMAACAGCQRAFQEMRNALEIMRQREKQLPDEEFMNRFWTRLSPRLQDSRRRSHPEMSLNSLFHPRFVLPLTAILCLFVGIWIGQNRAVKDTGPLTVGPQPAKNGKGIPVETTTSQVLERSQRVLLAFSNFNAETDDPEILNLTYQKSMARHLVQETGKLKAGLSNGTDRKLALLLQDLELILLQIANLEDSHDLDNIEIIREGVNKRSILFKIQINTLDRDEKQDTGPFSQHT